MTRQSPRHAKTNAVAPVDLAGVAASIIAVRPALSTAPGQPARLGLRGSHDFSDLLQGLAREPFPALRRRDAVPSQMHVCQALFCEEEPSLARML